MEFYRILETLTKEPEIQIAPDLSPYVAILSTDEWRLQSDRFDMFIDIDIDLDTEQRLETRAIVNFDSLTGCFSIPDRSDISGITHSFFFALDEKGIVLIDDSGYALQLVEKIRRTKKWRLPGLERFLYDFLEEIIERDLFLLESFENRLSHTEDYILNNDVHEFPVELNSIRGDLLDLRVHYEQLIDLGQELEENENGFFKQENLRFFRLFTERVIRLEDNVTSLRDYTIQLRDLVHSQLSVRQNKIMTLLTVITSIFMPLTLIAGWYGMNFRYMPELQWRYSYIVVILVSIAIVVGCLIWFKKNKWL